MISRSIQDLKLPTLTRTLFAGKWWKLKKIRKLTHTCNKLPKLAAINALTRKIENGERQIELKHATEVVL